MNLGKYFFSGFLFAEADGNGGNGGGDGKGAQQPVIDPKILAEAVKAALGTQLSDMAKRFEGIEKRFQTQDQKDAEAARLAEEERQRKEDEEAAKRAGQGGGSGAGAGDGNMDAAARQLQRQLDRVTKQLDDEKKKREETETHAKAQDRANKIRRELDKFEYAKPIGKELAYKHIDPLLKTDDNGEIVTPDGTPVNVWLKDLFEGELDTLAAPKAGLGGSGATGGRGSATNQNILLTDIAPGSKKLELARAEIARLVKEQMGGRL